MDDEYTFGRLDRNTMQGKYDQYEASSLVGC